MTFVVTEKPPWYWNTQNDSQSFTCDDTTGLFDQVARSMSVKSSMLSGKGMVQQLQQKTTQKLIRDMVIDDIGSFKQNPSRALLRALMDIVDIEANELECMSTYDRAGMKQLLLSLTNYTLFYIPSNELKATADNKKIIPVVTVWSQKNAALELHLCDRPRSMLGTYTVELMCKTPAYFMQQVLVVPGVKSLGLLKDITGNKYHFWDMSLEVPSHPDALTPAFKHIQVAQLLRVDDKEKSNCDEPNTSNTASYMEPIQPMCCVLDTESVRLQNVKVQGSVDCFDDTEVACDLSNFTCDSGVTKTVYFRRMGKVLERKQGNVVAVVSLKDCQIEKRTLYISTTARFCRALKSSCLKGSGELLRCGQTTLIELTKRETFLSGPELHPEIIRPALTAFMTRICPATNNWCIYTPTHLACFLEHPIMCEIVDLSIKLMCDRIPNAFAVAELLLCPMNKVNQYMLAHQRYTTDRTFYLEVHKNNISSLENQMKSGMESLVVSVDKHIELRNRDKKYKLNSEAMIMNLRDMIKAHNAYDNINVIFKQWQQLIKQEAQGVKEADKLLSKEHINTKVLFHNLCVYQKKIGKLKTKIKACEEKKGEDENYRPSDMSAPSSPRSDKASGSKSATARSSPETTLTWGASLIVPDNPPLVNWIRNIGTLLMSTAWLYANNIRREAVCNLLGLENTLLHKKNTDVLNQWVAKNPTLVEQLKHLGLQDKLSLALINSLKDISMENWIRKIECSFRCKPANMSAKLLTREAQTNYKSELDKFTKKSVEMSCFRVSRDLFSQVEHPDSNTVEDSEGACHEEDDDEDDQGENLIEAMDDDDNERLDKYDDENEESLIKCDLHDDISYDSSYEDNKMISRFMREREKLSWTQQKKPRAQGELYAPVTEDSGGYKPVLSSDPDKEVPLARNTKRRQCVMSNEEEEYEEKASVDKVSPRLTKKNHSERSHLLDRKTSKKKPDETDTKSSLTSDPPPLTSYHDSDVKEDNNLRKGQGLYSMKWIPFHQRKVAREALLKKRKTSIHHRVAQPAKSPSYDSDPGSNLMKTSIVTFSGNRRSESPKTQCKRQRLSEDVSTVISPKPGCSYDAVMNDAVMKLTNTPRHVTLDMGYLACVDSDTDPDTDS